MSTIKELAQQILIEKNNKILANKIEKDWQIFDVTGSFEGGSGDIKLFDTVEHMQEDENPQEGDLAVVYRSEIYNWNGESSVSGFIFPQTVTLSESYTGSMYGDAEGGMCRLDGSIQSDSAYIRVDNMMSGDRVNVQYSSQDGLTYTLTSSDSSITFDEPITFDMYEWDNTFGNFMTNGGMHFDGLYEYSSNKTQLYNTIGGFTVDFNAKTVTPSNTSVKFLPTLYEIAKTMYNLSSASPDYATCLLVVKKNNVYYGYNVGVSNLYFKNNNILLAGYSNNSGDTIRRYILDLDTYSYTFDTTVNMNVVTNDGLNSYHAQIDFDEIIALFASGDSKQSHAMQVVDTDNKSAWVSSEQQSQFILHQVPTFWHFADTQLTLENPNQLLPDITGYGPYGTITGDNRIYDNLDNNRIFQFTNVYTTISDKNVYGKLNNCICSNREYNKPLYLVKANNGSYLCGMYNKHNYTGSLLHYYENLIHRIYYDDGNRYYFNSNLYNSQGTLIREVFNSDNCSRLGLVNGLIFYIDKTTGDIYKYDIITDTSTKVQTISFTGEYKGTHYIIVNNNIYFVSCSYNNSVMTYTMYVYDTVNNELYTNANTFSTTVSWMERTGIIYTNAGVYFIAKTSYPATSGKTNNIYHFNLSNNTFSDLGKISMAYAFGTEIGYGYVDIASNTLYSYNPESNVGYMSINLTSMVGTLYQTINIIDTNGTTVYSDYHRSLGGIKYLSNGNIVYLLKETNKLYAGSFSIINDVLTFTATDEMYLWNNYVENEMVPIGNGYNDYDILSITSDYITIRNMYTDEQYKLYRYNKSNSYGYDCMVLNTYSNLSDINGYYLSNNIIFVTNTEFISID